MYIAQRSFDVEPLTCQGCPPRLPNWQPFGAHAMVHLSVLATTSMMERPSRSPVISIWAYYFSHPKHQPIHAPHLATTGVRVPEIAVTFSRGHQVTLNMRASKGRALPRAPSMPPVSAKAEAAAARDRAEVSLLSAMHPRPQISELYAL